MNAALALMLAPALYLLGAVAGAATAASPARARFVAGVMALAGAAVGIWQAIPVLLGAPVAGGPLWQPAPFLTLGLRLDPLSAWFVLLLSSVAFAVCLAGLAYGRAYDAHGGARLAGLVNLFLAAMFLVVVADGAFGFLLAWEIMALVSYLLVVHEHHEAEVRRAGFIYLAMTHLGTAFLLVAFFILHAKAGAWDFASFQTAALSLDPSVRDLVFLLALVGFATKAGAVPLHVWLPLAHPVAPSHVSALMSGVMLKIGIYGLVRLTWDVLGGGPAWWGWLVLVMGLTSAVLGVLYALMEHDLKRLLAFHSVENVGIILIGIGAALVLAAWGQPAGATLALAAGLFHALNHALFKALLFLGAGAIHQATGTKDLERLGGLIHRMPVTAVLFLIGAAAIAALPPLNGFASEWLTFQGLLILGVQSPDHLAAVGAALAGGLLALTGALAAACFVKAFGVGFLALPRTEDAERAKESPVLLRVGMGLLAAGCVALGLLPGVNLQLLASVVGQPVIQSDLSGLAASGAVVVPSGLLGALLAVVVLSLVATRLVGGRTGERRVPTWACGFALRSDMAYGSTAFAKPIRLFFRHILRPERAMEPEYALAPFFLTRLVTHGSTRPIFERHLYEPVARTFLQGARTARALQGGNLRLYLWYLLATLLILLLGTR